jgi:hypothetical protein
MSEDRQNDAMHFSIGGFEATNIELELKDGVLLCRAWEGGAEPENGQQLHPSPEKWERFWLEVERIGVWKWEQNYTTPDVLDGASWFLKLQHGGHAIETGGSNGYPETDGPEYSQKSPFAQFLRALKQLSGVKGIR